MNLASGQIGQGIAPGSYVSIFGRALSEVTRVFNTPYLPLALSGVSVSFDVPSQNLSLPARIHFVSDGQINVQVPWELRGATSAVVKVSIGDTSSDLVTVPINDYAPAVFEYPEPSSGRTLAAVLDSASIWWEREARQTERCRSDLCQRVGTRRESAGKRRSESFATFGHD